MYHLGLLNKNLFRKYPLRDTSSMTDIDGKVMPTALLSGLKISTIIAYSNLFISRIVVNGNFISVCISHHDTSDTTIGYFLGNITKDFQPLKMHAMKDFAAGSLHVGTVDVIKTSGGSYNFAFDDGRLEDSVVTCIPVPGVHSINSDTEVAQGRLTLVLDNISENIVSETINLDVINKGAILSRDDKTAERLSCSTNIIKTINSVPPDSNGNIDIFGIAPVVITVETGGVGIGATITTSDVCSESHITVPATRFYDIDTYPNVLTATEPEWRSWPNISIAWEGVT